MRIILQPPNLCGRSNTIILENNYRLKKTARMVGLSISTRFGIYFSFRTVGSSQDLINVEPFSEVDWVGVFGAQTQGVGKFVGYIHDIVVA